MLNIEKAEKILGWTPTYNANEAIKETVEWYKKFYNDYHSSGKMYDYTIEQINSYERSINWNKNYETK